jgi:hypothetical protein
METGGSSVIRTQGKGVGLETALAHAASGDAARSAGGAGRLTHKARRRERVIVFENMNNFWYCSFSSDINCIKNLKSQGLFLNLGNIIKYLEVG